MRFATQVSWPPDRYRVSVTWSDVLAGPTGAWLYMPMGAACTLVVPEPGTQANDIWECSPYLRSMGPTEPYRTLVLSSPASRYAIYVAGEESGEVVVASVAPDWRWRTLECLDGSRLFVGRAEVIVGDGSIDSPPAKPPLDEFGLPLGTPTLE